jgi:DNA-binding IclR family transcriptional regulator
MNKSFAWLVMFGVLLVGISLIAAPVAADMRGACAYISCPAADDSLPADLQTENAQETEDKAPLLAAHTALSPRKAMPSLVSLATLTLRSDHFFAERPQ